MDIDVKRDSGRRLRALLRSTRSVPVEIELTITTSAEGRLADRILSEVARILEDLRFCGINACGCDECDWHQLKAIIGRCHLPTCNVSATVTRDGSIQPFIPSLT